MHVLIFICFTLILNLSLVRSYTVEELRCGVCKAVASEMENIISGIRYYSKTEIGSFRINEKGNVMSTVIPLVRSEVFLSEALETACEKMENYARGLDKKTGKLRVVKMTIKDSLNPEMSEVNVISDADLNESLKYHCEDMTDEFEPEFMKVFKERNSNSIEQVCVKETHLCDEI